MEKTLTKHFELMGKKSICNILTSSPPKARRLAEVEAELEFRRQEEAAQPPANQAQQVNRVQCTLLLSII